MTNEQTYGFVTIATGNERYYQLASNLLRSYRLQSGADAPFAIICDRKCSFTEDFDQVVIMEQPSNTYLDKLHLFRYSPYDRTIFVDADSLFLSNPGALWTDFADCMGLSCYGKTFPANSRQGWFEVCNTGAFQERLTYTIGMHGGIYYFTKSEDARNAFSLALDLVKDYNQYQFRDFIKPADEPVVALAMAVNEMHPCEQEGRILFLHPVDNRLKLDVFGNLFLNGKAVLPVVLHFATKNTNRFIYRYLTHIQSMRCQPDKQAYFCLWIKCLPLEVKARLRRFVRRGLKRILPRSVIDQIRSLL